VQVGDRGEHVRRLQLALEREGFDLPRYGADGDFGEETKRALLSFAVVRGLAWRSAEPVPEALLDALGCGEVPDEPPAPARVDVSALDLGGVELFDLRGEQSNPHPKSKRGHDGATIVRSPASIDAIVLHQTATDFSPPRGQSGPLALARRSLGVACHAMAFRDGFVTLPAEPLWYLHHADRLNARSLGLEVEGNYPGLVGRKVAQGKPTELTEQTIEAARAGVKLLVEVARAVGCPVRYIFAHRQTDSWRTADPGEALWRAVVLDYAVPVLGLETRPSDWFAHHKGKTRNGKPIPAQWDPAGVGKY
jgi:hypothetical protein